MNNNSENSSGKDQTGPVSLVVGAIGTAVTVVFSVKHAADWKDYALIGSGWTAALLFAIFLWRASRVSERSHKEIGALNGELKVFNERVKNLEDDLKRCHAVSHYLATVERSPTAKPRVVNENQ